MVKSNQVETITDCQFFRKVVGFIYPVSVLGLIAMDGILQDKTEVDDETLLEVYELLKSVFNCLAVAMRLKLAYVSR